MSLTEDGVRSKRTAQVTGLTILDRIIHFVKQAGAPSEEATERDGFLSYKSETHALGAGLGLGFMIGAAAELSVIGVILTFVLYGNRSDNFLSPVLIHDIRSELQYFIPGFAIGLTLGIISRFILGLGLPL